MDSSNTWVMVLKDTSFKVVSPNHEHQIERTGLNPEQIEWVAQNSGKLAKQHLVEENERFMIIDLRGFRR